MGLVWEAYHKGVPLSGVPENPTDYLGFWKQLIFTLFSHSHGSAGCDASGLPS